ncbi:MAG: ATP-dependent nuclease, partial [Promethearchaeota archaeon]
STKYHFAYNGFDYSIPEIKNEYGFLDDEKLSSKSKIQKSSTVPQEFKDYLDDFCRCLPKGEKFSKSHLLQVKRDYISQKIKEENIPSKIKWAPLSIRKNEFSRYFGHYFFIPAVQDITKETTFAARSSSNLTKLMKYIFEKMQNQERQQRYEQNIRKIIQEIYRIDQPNSEIYKLQTSINSLLSDFDGSKIRFDTELPSIDKVVRDSLKIFIDDGVETEVMHKGHGLQRYFMVILFKAWANRIIPKSKEPPTSLIKENSFPISSSSVFFAVEEPELFLHPQYQRLMKHYLKNIAENPDNQVILNTHSTNFIDFKEYEKIVRVVKSLENNTPSTKFVQPLDKNKRSIKIKDITHSHGKDNKIREKFHEINALNLDYFMDPHRNELFFADRVVLVEGETEKLMFQRWAEYFLSDEPDLLATTTYVDMVGKFHAQLYETMLNGFEIPYVIIVDNDRGSTDPTMKSQNYHIKKTAKQGTGIYIELDIDFENEFGITGHELDRSGQKKHKPYVAFRTFFDADGNPIHEQFERIRNHPKWRLIVKSIYDIDLS